MNDHTAPPPNYHTNKNLHVEKLLEKLHRRERVEIEFIDVWGEGYLSNPMIRAGFRNSYNINQKDQLVSNPPDKDRQIPNLIPVDTYDSDFRFIFDESVKILTVMAAPITELTANEMSRIIDYFNGNILIYGYEETETSRKILASALQKIGLSEARRYTLSEEFQLPNLEPVVVYTNETWNPEPHIFVKNQ